MGEPAYIIDAVIAATAQRKAAADGSVDKLLSASTLADILRQFCLLSRVSKPLSREGLYRIVQWQIAQIDNLLNEQINAILHHHRFQRLEATWRGLLYLVTEADGAEQVKIRVLDISWKQVARDLERAIEFDQSQLFRKIFKQEFGSPGGEPLVALALLYLSGARSVDLSPQHLSQTLSGLALLLELHRVRATAGTLAEGA